MVRRAPAVPNLPGEAASSYEFTLAANNRKEMARHGCIKLLVQRLKSRDVKVQCWSLCAIGNMCILNGMCLKAVPLAQSISDYLILYLLPDENKKAVMQDKGIDQILRLLKSSDETTQRWSCNAVGIICMDCGTSKSALALQFLTVSTHYLYRGSSSSGEQGQWYQFVGELPSFE